MNVESLSADARTVATIARHFDELRGRAARLIAEYGASQRGYFTPTEDEQVRHLLVSYWQTRNALAEVVHGLLQSARTPEGAGPATFLVAFSGALVLVDAARFLRENVHDRPIVRQKLNEPEPHFQIPAGTYETIQKSLTSPIHAWHLYYAWKYYERHRADLQLLGRDPQMAVLLELVEQLHSRLDVGLREYTLARTRVNVRRMWNKLSHDLVFRAIYGLQKSVSRLMSELTTAPGHRPQLPQSIAANLRDILVPGDVLITRKEHAVTNYFLPGFWPHAALYLGDGDDLEQLGIACHANVKPRWLRLLECDRDEPRRVLEALKDGVWLRSLNSPFSVDAIAVIRPRLSHGEIAEALARGMFHEGKPYDFDFDFSRSDRLVCTEVVYRSYEGVGDVRFQLKRRAGRQTLAAEDLLEMALERNTFETVAAFAPQHTDSLLVGEQADRLIRETRVPHS